MIDTDHIALCETQIPDLQDIIEVSKDMLQDHRGSTRTSYVRFYKNNLTIFTPENAQVPEPQCVFFAAVTGSDPTEIYSKISAVFTAYKPLEATAAYVATYAKYGDHYAMISSCICNDYAYIFVFPYEKLEDGKINWLHDITDSSHVDEFEIDGDGQDVISMYYHHTHLVHTPYTLSEVYSYLSDLGIAFQPETDTYADVPYFDFS